MRRLAVHRYAPRDDQFFHVATRAHARLGEHLVQLRRVVVRFQHALLLRGVAAASQHRSAHAAGAVVGVEGGRCHIGEHVVDGGRCRALDRRGRRVAARCACRAFAACGFLRRPPSRGAAAFGLTIGSFAASALASPASARAFLPLRAGLALRHCAAPLRPLPCAACAPARRRRHRAALPPPRRRPARLPRCPWSSRQRGAVRSGCAARGADRDADGRRPRRFNRRCACVRRRRPAHVRPRHERGARIRANRCRGNVSKQPQMSSRAPVAGASKNPLIGPAGRLELIFMESRLPIRGRAIASGAARPSVLRRVVRLQFVRRSMRSFASSHPSARVHPDATARDRAAPCVSGCA